MPRQKGIKPIAHNKKAFHDYFVEDRYECGMSLRGTEVKSVRDGRISLKESFCMVRNGEIFAEGMHISPYSRGNMFSPDPLRPKKLLLHRGEIRKLHGLVSRKGYALIPLKVYLKDGLVKLELGLCRGKHMHDKRESEAARDAQHEMERAFSQRSN
ncbi:MAG: SsrA-binding protein SmpB [Clostridiales bacterium]|nr:SsrA-binding protein SmpB [Clostridiales bacterium]